MLCPDCKSRSIVQKDGQRKCEAKGCMYIQFHIISYDNQNRQFEGEKGTENRFNAISFNAQNGEKQSHRYQKNVDRAKMVIKQLAKAMKLSNDLQDKAEAKLTQILRYKYPEDKDKQTKDKKQQKLQMSDKEIAAYCLWLACCDKGLEFKDVRIANEMGISKQNWQDIHTKIEKIFKTVMNIPSVNPEQFIRRICRKHKINKIEENAMLQMAKNIEEAQIKGGKQNVTVAACIFWQIMKRSSTYERENDGTPFDIKKYLKKSKPNDGEYQYWTQKQFDISYQAIRKFLYEDIGNKLREFLPIFATRIPQDRIRNNEDRRN